MVSGNAFFFFVMEWQMWMLLCVGRIKLQLVRKHKLLDLPWGWQEKFLLSHWKLICFWLFQLPDVIFSPKASYQAVL